MAEAALQGAGVALLPAGLFASELRGGRLVQPFEVSVSTGRYWLTRLKSRRMTPAMQGFRTWLLDAVAHSA